MESGPAQIDRYDRQRYVTIGADLGGMALGAATTAAHELPAAKSLPSSVKLIQTGDAEPRAELSGRVYIMPDPDRDPVRLLRAGPAVQGLRAAGDHPVRAAALAWRRLLRLAVFDGGSRSALADRPDHADGDVTKNSILLVEYRGRRAPRAWSRASLEALLDACHKRARPIVMTSVAMIPGMVPIVLGLGARFEVSPTDGGGGDRRSC